jgi:hypothetical protein
MESPGRPHLINRKPKKTSMFDESVKVQKVSRDIVIYSALAGQIVKVAWLVCYLQFLLIFELMNRDKGRRTKV